MAGKERITRGMSIGEIATKYQQSMEIMLNYGLHCIGCMAASFETLEEGCRAHGMSEKSIDKLIKELNDSIRKPSGKTKASRTKSRK